MTTVGVMIPGSTLYPSIGVDFLQGIRSCLSFHGTDISLSAYPIGYGLKEEDIYKQAEKFLLSDNADAVIIYADDRHAAMLSPLFSATGKLLIMSGTGANYPPVSGQHDHTLFHSFNDSIHSLLTGRLCARESSNRSAIMATSYYDGGYLHCHAMTDSFMRNDGVVKHNFVSHYRQQDFSLQPLAGFIQQHTGVKDILCIYSGDVAHFFNRDIIALQQQYDLRLYGSPMLFDRTPGDFTAGPLMPVLRGYTGWLPSLNNESNRDFSKHFYTETGKETNLFVTQGWEAALLMIEYMNWKNKGLKTPAAINEMKCKPFPSPRGCLRIHPTHTVLGPAYLVNTNDQSITVECCIEDISPALLEMRTYIPDSHVSNWRNTYLCI